MPASGTITVNGEVKAIAAGQTLRGLIEQMGLAKQAVAAEVNGTLVPRRAHDGHALHAGDRVEVVSLVGGG